MWSNEGGRMNSNRITRRKLVAQWASGIGVCVGLSGCLSEGNGGKRSTAEVYVSGERKSNETEQVANVLGELHQNIGADLDGIIENMSTFSGVLGESNSSFEPNIDSERTDVYTNKISDVANQGTEKQQTMTEYVSDVVSVIDGIEDITPVVKQSIENISGFEKGVAELDGELCEQKSVELSNQVDNMYSIVNSMRASRANIARGDLDVGNGLSFSKVNRAVERVIEIVDYFGLIERGFDPLGSVVGDVVVVTQTAPDREKTEMLREALKRISTQTSEAYSVYTDMDDVWDANLEADVMKIKCVSNTMNGMADTLLKIVRMNGEEGSVPRALVMSVVGSNDECNYSFLQEELSSVSRRYL